jgi:hypothetical protein
MTAKKIKEIENESSFTSNGDGAFYGSVLKFNMSKEKEVDKDRLPLSCYFKVKNHIELLNLGKKFYKSYKEGKRVFAVSGFNTKEDLDQMLLALGAYFNYDHGVTCDLITPEFENNSFVKLVEEDMSKDLKNYNGTFLEFHKTYSLTQYGLDGLKNIYKSVDLVKYENILCDVFSKKDSAYFIALPSLNEIEKNLEFYYPIIQHIDSVAFLAELKKTKETTINKYIDYYKKSSLSIEGIILK